MQWLYLREKKAMTDLLIKGIGYIAIGLAMSTFVLLAGFTLAFVGGCCR